MNYLKQKLVEKNISQKDLAAKCGVLQSTISRYVNSKNKKSMPLDLAVEIAYVLNIDIIDFIREILKND